MKAVIAALQKIIYLLFIVCCMLGKVFARAGGGGGHSSGSHSSGGSHSFGGGGFGGGGSPSIIVIIIIILVIYYLAKGKNKGNSKSGMPPVGSSSTLNPVQPTSFPEGLNVAKVESSFMSIQEAWQQKDLTKVRKWISDGVYQRYTAQFLMMKKLSQSNMLSNINIRNIQVVKTNVDGNYQTADVAITFSMDDSFVSDKYPQFNENYKGDNDTEYWTFIKRNDAKAGANLYNSDNCPNCGATFDIKMGEISRCANCGTLTNNAGYDWVLSEITQDEDYNGPSNLTHDPALHELTKNDGLFSVQRIEDVISNIFMQIMEVWSGGNEKKLTRFADQPTIDKLLKLKASMANIVFDRLYLNDVTLQNYRTEADQLKLQFDVTVTYRRIQMGDKLRMLDDDMVSRNCSMVLSKNIAALKTPPKETVYSYECPSCGAPYGDTTNEKCNYCGEPVNDPSNNWVLTDFNYGEQASSFNPAPNNSGRSGGSLGGMLGGALLGGLLNEILDD